MELTVGHEWYAQSQSFQPKRYNSAFSAPLQVKQADFSFKKTKAEPEKETISEQETSDAIGQANKLMELFCRDLRFKKHDETGIVQVSVVDRVDGKVIKQIPPDEVLKMIAMIQDIIGGLIDVKA